MAVPTQPEAGAVAEATGAAASQATQPVVALEKNRNRKDKALRRGGKMNSETRLSGKDGVARR